MRKCNNHLMSVLVNLLLFVGLITLEVFIVNSRPVLAVGEEAGVPVNQVQVIRINPSNEDWENQLKKNLSPGDNPLILGHGGLSSKGEFSSNFARELASMRGYNKAIILDYGWHVGTPFDSTRAGYLLADIASIAKLETGNDPGVYGHSNFTVAINRSAYFITGSRLPWMPWLKPTEEMQKVRYSEVVFGGSPLYYETNLDILEGVITGRTQKKGEPALFNVYSPHDPFTIMHGQVEFGLKSLGKNRNIKVEAKSLLDVGFEHSRLVNDASLYKELPLVSRNNSDYSSAEEPTSTVTTMLYHEDEVKLCLETASTLEKALNYIAAHLDDGSQKQNIMQTLKAINNFAVALHKDIEMAGKSKFVLLSSYTLEQTGKFGLAILPDVVEALKKEGKLPLSYKLPPTFGVGDFVAAVARHVGSGEADINTITSYLDGFNKACWGIVGYLIGGPEIASFLQSVSGTAAELLRRATLPLFKGLVLELTQQGEELKEQWFTLQQANAHYGLPIQPISEVYGVELLIDNGLSKKEIQELDAMAHKLNKKFTQIQKDFGIEMVEELKQSGKTILAGEVIDKGLLEKDDDDTKIFPPPPCPPFCCPPICEGGDGVPSGRDNEDDENDNGGGGAAVPSEGGENDGGNGGGTGNIGISDEGRPYIIITVNGKPKVIWISKGLYDEIKGKKITVTVLKVSGMTIVVIYVDGKPVWEIHIGRKGGIIWQGPPQSSGSPQPPQGPILPPFIPSPPPMPPSRPPTTVPMPKPRTSCPKPHTSGNIGGVMLHDVAKVEGADEARVDLMSGNFSLVVDGQNARLDPAVLRKFVTALWSVYYSSEDPGISIDPIAPKEKKHLVRYIGKVMNNDLGRVMREADYVMKKWSVGTERADVPGFMNPDDAANRRGVLNAGAWSRFWFVPENMKFKRGGDMLLFDDGRMILKTEYMFMDDKDMRSDPSNEDFSRFFTEHYNEIAEKYPVYKDLFEYAKLVSLAKYLKEQGVPLYWFLMANKDLVITEDSPDTVDAFAKDSDYFKGVSIEGGVNLGFDVKQEGHYVYDQTAVDAIKRAVSQLPTNTTSTSISANPSITKTGSDPFSFDLGKESYTVLPQHSLTSGKDRRGIRYQTDIALRGAGFRLTEEALGNIEYYVYRRELAKEINPIVESMDKQKLEAEYENIYKEKDKIATGRAEKVIEKLKGLKDQDFKAEDKFVIALEKTLGKEQLDQFKPLILKHTYYKTNLEIVRYFNPNKEDVSEFGKGWKLLIPYQIKPHGDTKIEFLNVRIPEKMAVENLITGEQEVLTFSKDQYTSAGYVPEKIEKSQVVGLFLMTDVSYRLADKLGNQFWFDPSGYLTDMIFSEQQRVHVDYLGEFTDSFDQPPYHVQPAGKERVKFLNVRVPKKIEVIDLVRGGSEELVFSDKGECAGYVPEDEGKSRYKILALLSNGAYQLVDKEKNEIKFNPTGDFEGMFVHSSYPIVKSVSQGGHKVGFTYTTDKSGKVFIAHAYLSEDKQDAKPLYMVGYKYDDEGRLYRTKGESKLAEASRTSGNEVR